MSKNIDKPSTLVNNLINPNTSTNVPANTSTPLKNLRGSNNGTFGFGQVGCFLPESLMGPFGYMGYPLPNVLSFPVQPSPEYNSMYFNGPKYNENAVLAVSGNLFKDFSDDFQPLK